MQNAVTSGIQFTNPRVISLLFEQNKDYSSDKGSALSLHYEVNHSMNGDNAADMILKLVIGRKDNTSPFFIELSVQAGFLWDRSYDAETVKDLLELNCPTLLLSYARPLISHLTVDAGYPALFLPFIDLTKKRESERPQKSD